MKGTATPGEERALKDLLQQQRPDSELLQMLEGEWNRLEQPDARFANYDVDASWKKIVHTPGARVRPMKRWMWAAAAAVLVLGSGAIYLLRQPTVQQASNVVAAIVAPGSNKAVLTLADGSTVTLDSAGNQVLQQGNATIKQQGGQLIYDVKNGQTAVNYNTLHTPRGGNFRITLPDGTKVWLNAASSLRYPTAFIGKERLVEITGEAYFEVAADAQLPFKVKAGNNAAIEVLGTAFNISNYTGEGPLKATLLSGAIRVSAGGQSVALKPGQQAVVNGDITLADHADLGKVMAWKNGVFNFDDVSLQDAMRQVERWYDIDVVYENGVPDIYFGGKLPRNISLNDLLAALEASDVHFRIENNKLIVTK